MLVKLQRNALIEKETNILKWKQPYEVIETLPLLKKT